jgi:anaerobic ribonucleoside-triphosphate reductase activating protein
MVFSDPLLDGITLSGGEPMLQPKPLIKLCKAVIEKGLGVWIYMGYTFEELLDEHDPARLELLSLADVIVDGRFELSLRTLEKPFVGSSNQRLLDAKKSLAARKAVLYKI